MQRLKKQDLANGTPMEELVSKRVNVPVLNLYRASFFLHVLKALGQQCFSCQEGPETKQYA